VPFMYMRSAGNKPRSGLRSKRPPATLRQQSGFTIIELLIVVTIVGVLTAIAAPSLRTMIITNQVRTSTSDLLNDIAVARSESAKRSQRVVMCASTDMKTCAGSAWASGWISFVDANNNLERDPADAAEPLIRVKEPVPTAVKIVTTPATLARIGFRSFGIIDAAKTFVVCPSTTGTGILGRSITINTMGRVQTVNATTAACET
jgi:type IV fimbrial biogenesis protein FimT